MMLQLSNDCLIMCSKWLYSYVVMCDILHSNNWSSARSKFNLPSVVSARSVQVSVNNTEEC